MTTNSLEYRRLEGDELEMALSLAASLAAKSAMDGESWGITAKGVPANAGQPWGAFFNGTLATATWLAIRGAGTVEATALALPPGRKGTGLGGWLINQAAVEMGATRIIVTIVNGGPQLGEALADAGFTGPDLLKKGYPVGEWQRLMPEKPPIGSNN